MDDAATGPAPQSDAPAAVRDAAPLPAPPLHGLTLSRQVLDRRAERRAEPGLLESLWQQEGTRVLRVHDGRAAVLVEGEHVRLVLHPPAQVPPPAPEDVLLYLGGDGSAEFVAVLSGEQPPEDGAQWWGLRQAGLLLDDLDAGILTEAVAMAHWHAVTRFSPTTGNRLRPAAGGWVAVDEETGKEHFPRTDAAVIAAVIDGRDRLLLARQPVWPAGRYSILAGFVEPGESFETTVRREVLEEVGVHVGRRPEDVVYLGSQPWPFPASIMVGFAARAVSTGIAVDGEEIELAHWFSREELAAAIADGHVVPPSGISIARRIVEAWFGGPLPEPDGGARW